MVLVDVAITSKPVTLAKSSSLRSLDLAMCQIKSKLLHISVGFICFRKRSSEVVLAIKGWVALTYIRSHK